MHKALKTIPIGNLAHELINETTYKKVAKSDVRDRLEVEIGDSKQPEFYPQIKMIRWDNEVNVSARLVHDEKNPSFNEIGDIIKWQGDKIEAGFYELEPSEDLPEGGYEFDITLKEKPASNVIEFSLNTKGVKFEYQPKLLTTEEIAQGCIRPENVKGSYAIYCKDKKVNYVGGKIYRSGKIGHIYRPKIIDSASNWTWGELSIDADKGIMTVTIPQEFIETAIYPIRHAAGATIGYTSVGANALYRTSINLAISFIANTVTATTGDTIESFSAYISTAGGSTPQFDVAAYTFDGSKAVSRLASPETIEPGASFGPGWVSQTGLSQEMVNGTDYCVAIGSWVQITIYYDTGTAPGKLEGNHLDLPATWVVSGTDSGTHYSVYATYENIPTSSGMSVAQKLLLLMGA